MLRKLFAGHPFACRPFVEPDGTRGYHFRMEGSYATLLTGRVATDACVPEGIGSAWMTEFRGVLELAA
jgi:hypothetical protein